jgi:uncharacterized protein with von Willebrand factor type A (vWA) domain
MSDRHLPPDHRAPRSRYSRHDGVQDPFTDRIDVRGVMERISEDVLQGFGARGALRRLLEQGMEGMPGLDDLRRRIAQQREQTSTAPASQMLADLAVELDAIVDLERDHRSDRGDELGAIELELLPNDPAQRFRALGQQELGDDEARTRYEQLRDRLTRELLDAQFSELAAGIQSTTPEDLARFREMLADLNDLVAQRDAGIEPDLDEFLEKHGQFFPERPGSLDELLAQLAARMAAASRLMASLPADQRRQLQELMSEVFDDPDLQLELMQLEASLRELAPNLPWDQADLGQGQGRGQGAGEGQAERWSGEPGGQGSLSELLDDVERLGELDQLEQQVAGDHPGATLDDIDEDALRRSLGDDAVRDLRRLKEVERQLEEAGALRRRGGELELTPRGARLLGEQALTDLLRRVRREPATRTSGADPEPTGQTRPWTFGATEPLAVQRTLQNAVTRGGLRPGRGLRLHPDDLEVVEHEVRPRTATALLLDLSYSMPLQGHLVPAKKMALALHALITGKHRQDSLHLIGFSDYARRLQPADLAEPGFERVYGTNMQHAFLLARRLLMDDPRPHKQVIMVTDGEPTAHLVDGTSMFNWPPVPATLEATLREAMRLSRSNISLDVFLLEDAHGLVAFSEKLAQITGGSVTQLRGEALGRHIVTGYDRSAGTR